MKKSNRYDTSALPEAQFEPGSRDMVLKNKLGIKRKKEMDETESVALAVAIDKLLRMYDADHRFQQKTLKQCIKYGLVEFMSGLGNIGR